MKGVKPFIAQNGRLPNTADKGSFGFNAVSWLNNQRTALINGKLIEEKLNKLIDAGVPADWLNKRESYFDKGYKYAKAYYDEHGVLNIKTKFVCSDGFRLGFRTNSMRKKKDKLTSEQTKKLDELGFVW